MKFAIDKLFSNSTILRKWDYRLQKCFPANSESWPLFNMHTSINKKSFLWYICLLNEQIGIGSFYLIKIHLVRQVNMKHSIIKEIVLTPKTNAAQENLFVKCPKSEMYPVLNKFIFPKHSALQECSDPAVRRPKMPPFYFIINVKTHHQP